MDAYDLTVEDWRCLEWLQHGNVAVTPCTQVQLLRLQQQGYVERHEQTVLPGLAAHQLYRLTPLARELLYSRQRGKGR